MFAPTVSCTTYCIHRKYLDSRPCNHDDPTKQKHPDLMPCIYPYFTLIASHGPTSSGVKFRMRWINNKYPHNPLLFLSKLNSTFGITTRKTILSSSSPYQVDRTLKGGHKHRQDVFQLAKFVCASPLLNSLLLCGTCTLYPSRLHPSIYLNGIVANVFAEQCSPPVQRRPTLFRSWRCIGFALH